MATRLASLVFAVGLAAGVLASCFIESPKPSTFRFTCEASEDCEGAQVCSEGLCQYACGGEDDEACPDVAPICFNGHCSSVCPVDEDVCPEPQTCLTLEDPSAEEPAESGICAIACDDAEQPCAAGQICLLGACLTSCVTDDECSDAESCVEGFCVTQF